MENRKKLANQKKFDFQPVSDFYHLKYEQVVEYKTILLSL